MLIKGLLIKLILFNTILCNFKNKEIEQDYPKKCKLNSNYENTEYINKLIQYTKNSIQYTQLSLKYTTIILFKYLSNPVKYVFKIWICNSISQIFLNIYKMLKLIYSKVFIYILKIPYWLTKYIYYNYFHVMALFLTVTIFAIFLGILVGLVSNFINNALKSF